MDYLLVQAVEPLPVENPYSQKDDKNSTLPIKNNLNLTRSPDWLKPIVFSLLSNILTQKLYYYISGPPACVCLD